MPVFDSAVPDPNLVSLFQANRYTGLDRLGDANEVTLGLTVRMLSSSGQRFLSAMIGQSLNFSVPRVALPVTWVPPLPVTATAPSPPQILASNRRSDLIADIDLTAYRNWTLHYDLAWSAALSQTEKSRLNLQYRPAGNQVVNVGYRFARANTVQTTEGALTSDCIARTSSCVDQADASVAWPIGRHWDVYGRSVYSFGHQQSLSANGQTAAGTVPTALALAQSGVATVPAVGTTPIENFAGFQYRGNCWGLRIVGRRSVTRVGTLETGWYLQLELNGLSSVGSGADSFLKGEIQGYSPTFTSH